MSYNQRNDLSIKEKNNDIFGNIKNKKSKFIFLVTLIVFTLLLISITDNVLHYDDTVIKKHAQLLVENNEKFIQIEKYKIENGQRDVNIQELTDDDIIQINQKLKKMGKTGKNIYRVGNLHIPSNKIMTYESVYDVLKIAEYNALRNPYTYSWDEVDIIEWNDFEVFFIGDVTGRMPESYDEVLISNRFADLLIREGLKPFGKDDYYKPENYESLVTSDKYFHFGDANKVKIVGIINYDLSKFGNLKNLSWDEFNLNLEKYSVASNELSYRDKNIYNKIFVNNEFINHLNVNDPNTLVNNWKNKMVKTGILVMENTKNGFEKLLNDFKHDDPIMAKSTYSEAVDLMMDFQRLLSTQSLFSIILFCLVAVLLMSSSLLTSWFILSKQDMKELENQRINNFSVKTILLSNIFLIAIISVILSSIILILVPNFLNNFLMGGDSVILNPFEIGTRQFIVLFVSMIVIAMISYSISIIKTSKII